MSTPSARNNRSPARRLDERLGLPAGEFSYVLEDWLERLCVKESFHEATTSLRALLGLAPSARAAEQMNQRMAEHAEAFGLQLAAPPPAEEAEILVATADGKGVPMRRPLEARSGADRGAGKAKKPTRSKWPMWVRSIRSPAFAARPTRCWTNWPVTSGGPTGRRHNINKSGPR